MRDKTNIADAITAVNEIVAAQADALEKVKSVLATKMVTGNGGIAYGKPWVRPSNFPNYDFVDRTNEEAVYLSYDCTLVKAFPDIPQYASFYATYELSSLTQTQSVVAKTPQITVEQGYIDSSGFHAESAQDYVEEDYHMVVALPTNGRDYIVFRIAPKSGAKIVGFGLYASTAHAAQPCVEVWGRLPNLVGDGEFGSFRSPWLESCDVSEAAPAALYLAFMGDGRLRNVSMGNCAMRTDGLNYTFADCCSLSAVDLSGWDVSAATDIMYLFRGCLSLVAVDLSSWDTSNMVNTSYMFDGCESLQSINLTGWNTSKLEDVSSMFESCNSLTSLDLSGWNTSKLFNAISMFRQCTNLTSLNLTGWDTSALQYTQNMFESCSSLESLDLSGWDTSAIDSGATYGLFRMCQSLTLLNLTGWNLSDFDSDMFGGCISLVDFYPGTFHTSYSLKDSDKLSDESIARIINALPTVTTSETLTLHATVKAKLTDAQISAANTKGWTIA